MVELKTLYTFIVCLQASMPTYCLSLLLGVRKTLKAKVKAITFDNPDPSGVFIGTGVT